MKSKIPLGLSYDDVLLIPQHSILNSRSQVDLTTEIAPGIKLKLPLISVNMNDVTGVEMAVSLGKMGGLGFLPRFMSVGNQAEMVNQVKKSKVLCAAAVGIKEGELDRADALVNAGADILTVDVAHGAMQRAIDVTRILKQKYGRKIKIISGVVGTYEGAYSLFSAGADSVRVGVGPGTICITRIVTGVGVPQITAVADASRAARKFRRTILCDGGTKNSGDIVKGLAAGASAVVIGSQLAGCKEAPGKLVTIDGKKFKTYNASTSFTEKNEHAAKMDNVDKNYLKYIEGVESVVPYKGELATVIGAIEPNLRAAFSYLGAGNITDLWKKANFIQVTALGQKENGHHDVFLKH